LILVVTLTFAASANFVGSLEENLYDSTATVAVSQVDPSGALIGVLRFPTTEPGATTARLEGTAFIPEVQVDAALRLRREHPNSGGGIIHAAALAPGVVRVGARHTDPSQATHIAQALAEAVVAHLNAERARETGRLIADLQRERRALGSRDASAIDPEDLGAFFDSLSQSVVGRNVALLKALQRTERPARIISPAVRPGGAVFFPASRVIPVTIAGFSLALIAAFLLDGFGRTARDPRRLEAAAGVPIAGLVPRLGRRAKGLTDAFQRLRWGVAAIGESPPVVVLVTSAASAEGKTSVAVGLAEASARAGRRTCLVEADLRRPLLAERLGLEGPGLAEVLRGADLEPAVHTVRTSGVDLAVLHAGARPTRPGELLSSKGLVRLLERLRGSYDLVVVDSPPLLAAADGMMLAGHADAALVCARAAFTRVDELQAACLSLRRVGTSAGLVVSGVTRRVAWSPGAGESRAARRRQRRWLASVPAAGREA
jgi:Mrp family chromosome partitioning ATPase